MTDCMNPNTPMLTYLGLRLTKAKSEGKSFDVENTRESLYRDDFFVGLSRVVDDLDLSPYPTVMQEAVLEDFRDLSSLRSEIDQWSDGITMLVGYCFVCLSIPNGAPT